ncbi:MAG: hypothetical protein NWE93_06635 [Candidatus Bathyarchaeota archaeon]|nr:hypothetical protein [Candidatus Bathyarchaeota archaeon]
MQITRIDVEDDQLRDMLVQVALEWERRFSVAPRITADIAEYDAAKLVNTSLRIGLGRKNEDTAVTKGCDFCIGNDRYQVKANRPSGKAGSVVTLVGKAQNFAWDKLIWILYDRNYKIQEAWMFGANKYKSLFENKKRLCPTDMRKGLRIY